MFGISCQTEDLGLYLLVNGNSSAVVSEQEVIFMKHWKEGLAWEKNGGRVGEVWSEACMGA